MEQTNKEHLLSLHIDEKIKIAKSILKETFEKYDMDSIGIAITGGKDSTTCLWIVREFCKENGLPLPRCIFIDEGDVFEEIYDFVKKLEKEWNLEIDYLKNRDIIEKAQNIGDPVYVKDISSENQKALEEIGFKDGYFPFIPDSPVCNHLLKTVPLREFILENSLKVLITAIRWDEHESRENEEFFSQRTNPPHLRVHPILHFKEKDIWIAIFKYNIPYNSLYRLGYRSLGARCATTRVSDIPAWMQDLENTPERTGRGKEKEKVMEQLRALGYM